MHSFQSLTLVAEIEITPGTTSEMVTSDLDQASRVLEEAISILLLQFLGEDGNLGFSVFELLRSPRRRSHILAAGA